MFACRSGIQKGMGYRYLNVHINVVNVASISCKNFVNFGPVTPELTELICERLVRDGQISGTFSRISTDAGCLVIILGVQCNMVDFYRVTLC